MAFGNKPRQSVHINEVDLGDLAGCVSRSAVATTGESKENHRQLKKQTWYVKEKTDQCSDVLLPKTK